MFGMFKKIIDKKVNIELEIRHLESIFKEVNVVRDGNNLNGYICYYDKITEKVVFYFSSLSKTSVKRHELVEKSDFSIIGIYLDRGDYSSIRFGDFATTIKEKNNLIKKRKTIYIVGIDTIYHRESKNDLHDYFIEIIKKYNIKHISEGFTVNEGKLGHNGMSTVNAIANEMSITHIYCSPTPEQRSVSNIEDGLSNLMSYWLSQLNMISVEPTVFVCLCDFVYDFSNFLRSNGYDASSLKLWTRNEFLGFPLT